MTAQIAQVAEVLEQLSERPSPTGWVLSVYLATGPRQAIGNGIILSLRDGCRALREGLPEEQSPAFESAVSQAESYLTEEHAPGRPGIALFASGSPDYFYVCELPSPPIDEVEWSRSPRLAHLQAIVDDYERVAVALFDKERARIFTVYLGQIESRSDFKDEVPGKQATGGWFALAQTRYARHHEDHVRRHAKRTVSALMALGRERPFDRLFLAGPDEALTALRAQLPRSLASKLKGSLDLELFASENDVLTAAVLAAEVEERREEEALVRELLEQASTPHVEVGVEATLSALSDGRVDILFVSESIAAESGECPRCGRLASAPGPCSMCGAVTEPVAMVDSAVMRALQDGARVEMVGGEAEHLLTQYGGMAARTRYQPD